MVRCAPNPAQRLRLPRRWNRLRRSRTQPIFTQNGFADEQSATPVRRLAWLASLSAALLGVFIYYVGHLAEWAAVAIWGEQKTGQWEYSATSVVLGVAAVVVTMFVATSLGEAWMAGASTTTTAKLGKRVATANLTYGLFLIGGSVQRRTDRWLDHRQASPVGGSDQHAGRRTVWGWRPWQWIPTMCVCTGETNETKNVNISSKPSARDRVAISPDRSGCSASCSSLAPPSPGLRRL